MPLSRFIHLRVHSEYSLLQGAVRLSTVSALCKQHAMPAVAITDTNNLFGALEFSEIASQNGIQPIIGCQIAVEYQPQNTAPAPKIAPIVLLAQNETGYQNLLKLNSCLYLARDKPLPYVTITELAAHNAGLICLTGGANGPLGALLLAHNQPEATKMAQQFIDIYPQRLYIELGRHPDEQGALPEHEHTTEQGFIDFAYQWNVPLVATNDVHFSTPDLFVAHDAYMCIGQSTYVNATDRTRLSPAYAFRSSADMETLFADLPEAIAHTCEIAERCAFKIAIRKPMLPHFTNDEDSTLTEYAKQGLEQRLQTLAVRPHAQNAQTRENADDTQTILDQEQRALYFERLHFEMDIIKRMGFSGYFLIVADFIGWAREQKIPVGPGRGSGAGSLVAYALHITNLDPIRYGLLFERFLNPDRISMPDFDIDFCADRREQVIHYVQQKYGADKVGHIITFGALLSKAAVRDLGRVLQIPYRQTDQIARLIPYEGVVPVSVGTAYEQEPRIKAIAERDPLVQTLLNHCQTTEGLLRNASTHAGGVVIGDRPLDTLVPLYRDARSELPATQFSMKWVEKAGLIKFDLLGVKTLTIIQNAVDMIIASGTGAHIPMLQKDGIDTIPLDDADTYALYGRARTIGVFQVESSGMRDALKHMRPSSIEDIIALVALYRPGPMENIPLFCDVKNGIKPRQNVHPLIDHLLDQTYGIIVYQEQVVQIAQKMGGYSLGQADVLRRAMGKKIQAEMDAEKPRFLQGAAERNVDKRTALDVWDLLQKFANYGFNKSHAAAYAVVSYQTAWLKTHYPAEFIAAVMNGDLNNSDKLFVFIEEAQRPLWAGGLGLPVLPPCIQKSYADFRPIGILPTNSTNNTNSTDTTNATGSVALSYALNAVRNVSHSAMADIVQEREQNGTFKDLYDFAERVLLKRIGKRSLEMLTMAGTFDALVANRRSLFLSWDGLIAYSEAVFHQTESDQVSLFGDSQAPLPRPALSPVADWNVNERFDKQRTAVGFYIDTHPHMTEHKALTQSGLVDWQTLYKKLLELNKTKKRKKSSNGNAAGRALEARIAGIIIRRKDRKSKRGSAFAELWISDRTGMFHVTLFFDALADSEACPAVGTSVRLGVEARLDHEDMVLTGRSITELDLSSVLGNAPAPPIANSKDAIRHIEQKPPPYETNGYDAVPPIPSLSRARIVVVENSAIGDLTHALLALPPMQNSTQADSTELMLRLVLDDLPAPVDIALGQFPIGTEFWHSIKNVQGIGKIEHL